MKEELLSSGTWDEEQRQGSCLFIVICHCTLQAHCKCAAVTELYSDTLTVPILQYEEKKLNKLVPYKRCQFRRQ